MFKQTLTTVAILGFVFASLTGSAQTNTDFDQRLTAKFSKKELKTMDANSLAYWTFFLDNSFEVQNIPGGKEDGLHHHVAVKPSDLANINILKLGLTPHKVARLYYGIEGTGKMIVLYGQGEIDTKFKSEHK